MAPARDLCFTPATELVRLVRARKTSPLELMHALLARIDAVNPHVNAIVTLARERFPRPGGGAAQGEGAHTMRSARW